MHVQPISPSLGAIVNDVDIRKPLSEQIMDELRALWLDRQVVVLRGQTISSKQYIAFASQLGTPDVYPFLNGLDEFPQITPILKRER